MKAIIAAALAAMALLIGGPLAGQADAALEATCQPIYRNLVIEAREEPIFDDDGEIIGTQTVGPDLQILIVGLRCPDGSIIGVDEM